VHTDKNRKLVTVRFSFFTVIFLVIIDDLVSISLFYTSCYLQNMKICCAVWLAHVFIGWKKKEDWHASKLHWNDIAGDDHLEDGIEGAGKIDRVGRIGG